MPQGATTHYDLLGVPRTASPEQIRRAYRQKMKEAHPDHFAAKLAESQASGNPAQIEAARQNIARAEALAKRINMAYATLSDPSKRSRYDFDLYMQSKRSTTAYRARSSTTYTSTHSRPRPRPSTPYRPRSRPSTQTARTPLSSQDLEARVNMWMFFFAVVMLIGNFIINYGILETHPHPRRSAPQVTTAATPTPQDADWHFERGLDYLAQSVEINDSNEQAALTSFMTVMSIDPAYALAYRMIGSIYYDRWRAGGSEEHRLYARQYLSRYESLIDGPADSEAQSMLAALDS